MPLALPLLVLAVLLALAGAASLAVGAVLIRAAFAETAQRRSHRCLECPTAKPWSRARLCHNRAHMWPSPPAAPGRPLNVRLSDADPLSRGSSPSEVPAAVSVASGASAVSGESLWWDRAARSGTQGDAGQVPDPVPHPGPGGVLRPVTGVHQGSPDDYPTLTTFGTIRP